MRYGEFIQSIQKNNLPARAVYVFSGSEGFLKDKGIELLKAAQPGISDEVISFRPDNFSPVDFMNELYALPFFKKKRLLVVDLPDEKDIREGTERALADYVKKPSEFNLLAVRSDKALHLPEPPALEIACDPLYDNELADWVVGQMRTLGRTISRTAANELVLTTGNNLVLIDELIQKLVLFAGSRTGIDETDIQALADTQKEGDVRQLVNYISEGRTTAALQELERLLTAGEAAERIIGFLGWHIQNKTIRNRTTRLTQLLECDRAIKTSRLPEELALKMFVIRSTPHINA